MVTWRKSRMNKPRSSKKATKSITIGELRYKIEQNNEQYGTKFQIGEAYGYYELWDARKGERIDVGSKKDIYNAFIRERLKESRRA